MSTTPRTASTAPMRLHHIRSSQLFRLIEYNPLLTTKGLVDGQIIEALSPLHRFARLDIVWLRTIAGYGSEAEGWVTGDERKRLRKDVGKKKARVGE